MSSRVAVIDVGSNSIKCLVAEKAPGANSLTVLAQKTLDVRISKGITGTPPSLNAASIEAGVSAVRQLFQLVNEFTPDLIDIVATSAVRDAFNGSVFAEAVKTATGKQLRILSGDTEAQLIGKGLLQDEALRCADSLFVFDLGGGSMECLRFETRALVAAVSLQLGCVRLTERFFKAPELALAASDCDALRFHVRDALRAANFGPNQASLHAVFAGGSMTTVRSILAAANKQRMEDTTPIVSRDSIAELCQKICTLPLAERIKALPGLPPARADVFPAALLTMLEVADTIKASSFTHSFFNLRFGLAAEHLGLS